jgi:hypothetical protein
MSKPWCSCHTPIVLLETIGFPLELGRIVTCYNALNFDKCKTFNSFVGPNEIEKILLDDDKHLGIVLSKSSSKEIEAPYFEMFDLRQWERKQSGRKLIFFNCLNPEPILVDTMFLDFNEWPVEMDLNRVLCRDEIGEHQYERKNLQQIERYPFKTSPFCPDCHSIPWSAPCPFGNVEKFKLEILYQGQVILQWTDQNVHSICVTKNHVYAIGANRKEIWQGNLKDIQHLHGKEIQESKDNIWRRFKLSEVQLTYVWMLTEIIQDRFVPGYYPESKRDCAFWT